MTDYVPRHREEQLILDSVERVRADGESRVVLLYGPGGVGKTMLVRALAAAHPSGAGRTDWLEPIDVDDSRYWLVSSLERFVVERLERGRDEFRPYRNAEANARQYAGPTIGAETVLSHLNRLHREFVGCYRAFVNQTDTVVVITLDTIETIRRMDLLFRVVQSVRLLPRTLFVLAGRPPPEGHERDPVVEWLTRSAAQDQEPVMMGGFTAAEARTFLTAGAARGMLNEREQERLIRLTGGLPLWLELAVEYLTTVDRPAIVTSAEPLDLDRLLPFDAEPAAEGQRLRENLERTLVARFHRRDYWSLMTRVLAVLRYSVDRPTWDELTRDIPWPAGIVSSETAWKALLDQPWVRPRANGQLVTLHDALAEALQQRVLPLDDQDGRWRSGLWNRAAAIYGRRAREPQAVRAELVRLTEMLRAPIESGEDVSAKIDRAIDLETERRHLDQLNTARLHYTLLANYERGSALFLELFEEASARHDVVFQELICHEMQRFLPDWAAGRPPVDALGEAVDEVQEWLRSEAGRGRYVEIVLDVARFLSENERAESAEQLLVTLGDLDDPVLDYRRFNALGNVYMRLPGNVERAKSFFQKALECTHEMPPPERHRRTVQAHKEIGFYFRNLGLWDDADAEYALAHKALSDLLGPDSTDSDRREAASIQTNWAYLKALQGDYEDARNLVESAITIRRRVDYRHGVAMSLSVSGEIYRYQDKLTDAWTAYADAEAMFEASRSWPWLGLLYQQQAICLHRAHVINFPLLDREVDQHERAKDLIAKALNICRDQGARSYPSALNRAGRIYGLDDAELGLEHLGDAIKEAKRLDDGWFLSASLIEYFELCYRAWKTTGQERFRERLLARVPEIEETIIRYQFIDLPSRWSLLQGHLAMEDAIRAGRYDDLDETLERYSKGFQMLAKGRVGSHGVAAIRDEFRTFRELFTELPVELRTSWLSRLRESWTSTLPAGGSISLLALLETLY